MQDERGEEGLALIEQGYDGSLNGDAYASVMYQNANLSVRLTDEFMQAALANKDWQTYAVTDPTKPMAKYRAKELLELIAEGTRICGDPGVQYHTTVNRWHTCPQSGEINASNPCVTGETLVATAQGYRRIRNLVGKSLHVIDGDGKPAWVDRVFPTGHKPVYEPQDPRRIPPAFDRRPSRPDAQSRRCPGRGTDRGRRSAARAERFRR